MGGTAIDTTAIAAIIIGLGGTAAAMVYPVKYPEAPKWAVNLSWWGGLLLVLAGVLYLIAEYIGDIGGATVVAFDWFFGHLVTLQRLPGFWLVVMFFGGLAVGVWLVPLARNKIKEGWMGGPIVKTWLTPLEAIETFVSPDLLIEDRKARDRVEMLSKKISDLGQNPAAGVLLEDAVTQFNDATLVAKHRHSDVMEILISQLGNGKLVAKGFKIKNGKIENHDTYIKIAFWRIHMLGRDWLNPEKQTASGFFGNYCNVSIGKNEATRK
jgi:hypothetical protein